MRTNCLTLDTCFNDQVIIFRRRNELVKSPVNSDKEFSTAYMELPELKESIENNQKSSSSSSTSLSTDEEEILKKLLEVDLSLARKLKKLKPSEIERNTRGTAETDNQITDEFHDRLKGLLQPPSLPHYENTTQIAPTQQQQPFVSFLSDIPKLPKFEDKVNNVTNNHKRPPPSKGLATVKKFNEDICLVPHELSTIAEADSQLSVKFGSKVPSPIASKSSLSPLKNIPVILLPQTHDQVAVNKKEQIHEMESIDKAVRNKDFEQSDKDLRSSMGSTSQSRSRICDLSCSKTSPSFGSSKQHSSSSDDVEAIEAMLRSIGMDWAIPTLHKTKEALALSSSSSSLDLQQKQKLFGNESISDTSLKAFLSNKFFNKISSSTLISDTSPVSILGEISDLSAVRGNSKERPRTSTPLTNSKTSKSKDGDMFSVESDISSVKNATSWS